METWRHGGVFVGESESLYAETTELMVVYGGLMVV